MVGYSGPDPVQYQIGDVFLNCGYVGFELRCFSDLNDTCEQYMYTLSFVCMCLLLSAHLFLQSAISVRELCTPRMYTHLICI